jgi:hypothetical protein
MNMVTIVCPKCGAEGKLSLVENNYVGPRRCWKCHDLFTITIVNNRVQSSEPLSQEEYDREEAKKAAEKGISFKSTSSQEDSDIPRLTPERRRNYNQPINQPSTQPPVQTEPEKPKAPAAPPDRFRTFVPLEENGGKEPEKPRAPKTPPPDRFRTFIPPAT